MSRLRSVYAVACIGAASGLCTDAYCPMHNVWYPTTDCSGPPSETIKQNFGCSAAGANSESYTLVGNTINYKLYAGVTVSQQARRTNSACIIFCHAC